MWQRAPSGIRWEARANMNHVDSATLDRLWHDFDAREVTLRRVVEDRLGANPPPSVPEHVVATYFFAFRTMTLEKAVEEISYHATSGVKHPPAGSLLEQCSARQAGVDAFDASGRIGLLHVAFPLKMMLQPDGHLTSTDLLHTVAGAIIFDVYENQDARLVALDIPDAVIATFPGPAYGPLGVRRGRASRRPAGLRDHPQADGGDHPRRRRADRRGGGGQPPADVHQGGRGPLPEPRLLAGRRADPARLQAIERVPRRAGGSG